jgi:hypothetical protein
MFCNSQSLGVKEKIFVNMSWTRSNTAEWTCSEYFRLDSESYSKHVVNYKVSPVSERTVKSWHWTSSVDVESPHCSIGSWFQDTVEIWDLAVAGSETGGPQPVSYHVLSVSFLSNYTSSSSSLLACKFLPSQFYQHLSISWHIEHFGIHFVASDAQEFEQACATVTDIQPCWVSSYLYATYRLYNCILFTFWMGLNYFMWKVKLSP